MAYLEMIQARRARRHELQNATTVIGRSRSCDLVLNGPFVSRQHAQVVCESDTYRLQDLGSRRGTLVNGRPLTEPVVLEENDAVTICDHLLVFHRGVDNALGDRMWKLSVSEESPSAVVMSTLDMGGDTAVPAVCPEAKLRAVLEITRRLHKTLRVDELLPKVLDTLFKIFPQAAGGFILLNDADTGRLVPKAVKNFGPRDKGVRISRTIIDQALEKRQGVLLADAQSDDDYKHSESISNLGLRSILCVPLLSQSEEPLGILQLHNEQGGRPFASDDLEVLVSVGATTAMALENADFHERQMTQERMMRELQLARDVQGRFLPAANPVLEGYTFYSHYSAAYTVGGDFFAFVELPGERLAMAVGDVSGKGMPAAMLMARVTSDVRFALISSPDPAAALRAVNLSLGEAGIEEKFVTLVLMVLDKQQHVLSIANAGHVPPLLRHENGDVEEIGIGIAGFPLNVETDHGYRYNMATLAIDPGKSVLAYTDGVTDAQNKEGERYGDDRLRTVFCRNFADAQSYGETIIEDVWHFAADSPQVDDITLVCFQRS